MKGAKRAPVAKQNQHRLNHEIEDVKEVRLSDQNGEQLGIIAINDAIKLAEESALDLVEISPNAEPPVCRIMDYGKFMFQKTKDAKEQKKKQKVVQTKEIKFRPGTDVGDYQVKLRNLTRFIEEGNKVKVTLRFRGREMAHQEIGMEVLNRLKEDTAEYALVESFPTRIEAKQMMMVLAPKKK